MYESMQEILSQKIENHEEALHKFIEGSLDLITLRRITYMLLNPEEFPLNQYESKFMAKYRQNREARFTEMESGEPPPIEFMNTMTDTREWAANYYDQRFGSDIGSAFWRDEWVKWKGGKIRDYAKIQGKTIRQTKDTKWDFRAEGMPRQLPEGYGKPNQVFGYEKEMFKLRRKFPRRGDKSEITRAYPASQYN
jgi:hypothetical protein